MDKKMEQEAHSETKGRREFLSKAGKVSLGVPAAALLVSVASKRAKAVPDVSREIPV